MKPEQPASRDDQSRAPAPRKPYEKPRLDIYGDLAQITQSVGTGTKVDGAAHPNKHFTD